MKIYIDQILGKTLLCLGLVCLTLSAFSQAEVQAWGNLRGVRVDGQLMRFESSFRVVGENWSQERGTGRERNWTTYYRNGKSQIVKTRIDSLFFVQKVQENAQDNVQVDVTFDPHEDVAFVGAFFHIQLAANEYAKARISLIEAVDLQLDQLNPQPIGANEVMRVHAMGLELQTADRKLHIIADQAVEIIVKSHPTTKDVGLYFTLQSAQAVVGKTVNRRFDISIEGSPDIATANLKLYPQYPGNEFLGMGGNFRLQNPKSDPGVIDYCLENLDVRMGRAEFPWLQWHPTDSIDPVKVARSGNAHPRVYAALEMAQRLYKMGMPVLLAAWFPPQWAAVNKVSLQARNADGSYGSPLRQDRMEEIYASLTSYILYLREAYGVEVSMFSFNESDLGINVRQTAEEHSALIKGLGAYMKSKGLDTKLLLGDTADANGFKFVNVSLDDPETWQYIGAVSFHSWRGWEKETLLEWFEAADRINVPLIIGEGSIDAAAWRYNEIFEESHYAMEEIKLYTRILAICQPQSILQWQLTADYSPLSGGGVFGNDSMPLKPTQRFWNLKQLSQTPKGLSAMPLTCDNKEMFVAALGNEERKEYAFHLVNDGPEREVILSGLPQKLKRLRLYVTDRTRGMEKGARIKVKNGEARFMIDAASFTSLMSD